MVALTSMLVLTLVINHVSAMKGKKPTYVNEWDKDVRFGCPDDQAIVQIHSRHDNNKEDRKWSYTCDYVPAAVPFNNCKEFGFVSSMTQREVFQCPNDGFIVGVYSKHSNKQEDRQTKYTCCNAKGYIAHSCQYTPLVNDFDGYLNYRVPAGYVLTGEMSIYDSYRHDRRWSYTICKLEKKKE